MQRPHHSTFLKVCLSGLQSLHFVCVFEFTVNNVITLALFQHYQLPSTDSRSSEVSIWPYCLWHHRTGGNQKCHYTEGPAGAGGSGKIHQLQYPGAGLHQSRRRSAQRPDLHPHQRGRYDRQILSNLWPIKVIAYVLRYHCCQILSFCLPIC